LLKAGDPRLMAAPAPARRDFPQVSVDLVLMSDVSQNAVRHSELDVQRSADEPGGGQIGRQVKGR